MAKSTTENPADRGGDETKPEEAAQAMVRASAAPPAFVQYVGTAHVREISKKDWNSLDIKDQNAVRFDKRVFRGDRKPVEEFTAAALEYLIQYDGGFVLLDAEGKKVS